MKRSLFAAILCMAGVALAGGYAALTQVQTGNGTNGMTYTVSGATDGVATPSGTFGGSFDGYTGRITVTGSAGVFQNASDISWLRCQHYGPNPDGGAFFWSRCPPQDIEIDGGQSGKVVGLSSMQWTVPLNAQINPSGAERWHWTGENLQQATTLDAGVNVGVELIGLP